tara:strand:- start:4145 stop:4582 length:438 start_codon:yes stop_codon:yes gene_type:complete
MKKITEFRGDFYFLSNFFPCYVNYEEILYPSSEHAYQAAKSLDDTLRIYIRNMTSPAKAKKFGRHLVTRANWDYIKTTIMKDILDIKFLSPELSDQLIATQDYELIEGNDWNDTFWGVYKGVGENNLGKILMEIRQNLLEKAPVS